MIRVKRGEPGHNGGEEIFVLNIIQTLSYTGSTLI